MKDQVCRILTTFVCGISTAACFVAAGYFMMSSLFGSNNIVEKIGYPLGLSTIGCAFAVIGNIAASGLDVKTEDSDVI